MKRVTSILLIFLFTILLLLGVVLFVLLTPTGQEYLTSQLNKYLKRKLNTRIEIGHISLQWPKALGVDHLYIEDLQGDTLIAAVKLKADLDMWGLIRGKIGIQKVEVEDVRGKIYRKAPEKDFNFQFIPDAFASSPPDTTSGEPLDMSWDHLVVRKIHLTYYDDGSGIDADIRLPEAEVLFSAFNPSYSRYHPTDIQLKNSDLSLRFFRPTDLGLPPAEPTPVTDTLDLQFGKIDFRNIKVRYNDEVSGLTTDLDFPKVLAQIDHVYLDGQRVGIKELEIANSKIIVAFNPVEEEVTSEVEADLSTEGWQVRLGSLRLLENEIAYDDHNIQPTSKGLDYAHINLSGLSGELDNFIYSPDSTAGNLIHLQLEEKSGLVVEKAAAQFGYTARQTFLKNLTLKTPHSSLGDQVVLSYSDLDQLSSDLGNVKLDFKLAQSKLGFPDLLLLLPDLAETPPFDVKPNSFIQGSAHLTGTVNNIQINEAVFSMPDATRLAVTGNITGMPDPEQLGMAIELKELSASGADVMALLPKGTLPDSVRLPDQMKLVGRLDGSLEALKIDAELETDQGNLQLTGEFNNITDSLNASYEGQLRMEAVDLGYLLMQPADQLGKVSLYAEFSGKGYSLTEADARLNGTISRADIKGYTYRNLNLSGDVRQGLANFRAASQDPNLDIDIEGTADLNPEFPAVTINADLRNLDFNQLNLYSDSVALAGNMALNLTSTNPANPLGEMVGTDLVLKNRQREIPIGTLNLQFSNEGEGKKMELQSSFASLLITGEFDYTALGDLFTAEINRYFQISDTLTKTPNPPYSFHLTGHIQQHDALKVFAPELTRLDRVNFRAQLKDQGDTTFSFSAFAPRTVYDSISVNGLSVTAEADGEKLAYRTNIDELKSESFRVRNFQLGGTVADNQADAQLTVKDSVDRNQHMAGVVIKNDGGDYEIRMRNRLILNYVPWRSDSTGFIRWGQDGLLVKDFTLFRNRSREKLIITSVGDQENATPYPNGPIRITADSIAIRPLVQMVTRDPKLASGRLDGDFYIAKYQEEAPVFQGDLSILKFELQGVPMGDFQLKADNRTASVIDLNMSLKGELNDVSMDGKYKSGTEAPLDFRLNLNRLDAKLIEAFSFGELKQGQGQLNGNLTIQGSLTSPKLNGNIQHQGLGYRISQLGTRYKFEDGTLRFTAPQLHLDNLTIVDTLDQKLYVKGQVVLDDLPNVGYQLTVNTDRFNLLNASRRDNDLVYGRVFGGANLTIRGKGTESVINGNVNILKGSNVTLILPDDDAGMDRGNGIVEFVTRKEEVEPEAPKSEGPVVVDFASELSLNIETDPDAEFTIVLDERNGDNLKVKGNANLNTGLAPNGQLYLLGTYELAEGAYELTFEILKKEFLIRKGSQIIWSGDPMQAELDIVAVYEVEADPSAFSPTNYRYGKVPFNVLLSITGNLSNPKIEFDLEVNERAGSALKNKIEDEQILSSFRNDASEMNKQVFGLLLMNRFMAETSNISLGGFSAEAIARQSVSKMLSDQLNYLASDLIKGVQLDFNLQSTTGATGGRTDLNVGLTKGFLNDRVTVSVGRNFELENSGESAQSSELFDNIAVNYKITRDGRYVLRAYRKNQFQTVLEGFIVETGVSFIVTLDYDAVKEFFEK